MRRIVLITALAALFSALAFLRLVLFPSPSSISFSIPAYATPPSQQYTSLQRGHWEPSPLSSHAALQAQFGPLGPSCFPIPSPLRNLSAEELHAEGEARKVVVSGWEWVPERGRMRPWDAGRVLRRLVNSERGLLLVGDSITGQMAATLHSMLLLPPLSQKTPTHIPLLLPSTELSGPPHHALLRLSLTLNPSHPFTAYLRHAHPFIPSSRFSNPVVGFLRNDLLLPFPEIEALFLSQGITGWVGEQAGFFAQQPWFSALPSSPSWEGEQPSLLILNTGAHWTPDHFYMPAGEYIQGYAALVHSLAPRLLANPKLHTVYRTISPPHTGCSRTSGPVYPAQPPNPKQSNPAWGWLAFPLLDTLWREELDALAPSGITQAGGRVGWLDVGEMAGQRPDAHLLAVTEGGEVDCMHWYGNGVVGEWVRMWWEMVEDP